MLELGSLTGITPQDAPGTSYRHEYHQSLVYKIFLTQKPDKVVIDLDQALAIIRDVCEFTQGIKQIVYLVGWQFDGHDSKYPAWSGVNERLRRPGDKTALAGLRWLMSVARQYNATVSVHINMCDAYENSPLWDEYIEQDLILRTKDGQLMKGGIWDGDQCYWVDKTNEWRSGYARRRIDTLVEMLPIADAGTIHIDVLAARPNPYRDITMEDEVDTIRQIMLYWRSLGIDVTKEWFDPEFVGLIPMVWHLNLDEAGRLTYLSSLICGGGSGVNLRQARTHLEAAWPGWFAAPQAGCLYEEAWGHSVDSDVRASNLDSFREDFYLKTLPWHFLNGHRPLEHVHTPDRYEVFYTSDVRTSVRKADRRLLLVQGENVLVDGTDVCLPAPWLGHECLIYSKTGFQGVWSVPDWGAHTPHILIRDITPGGSEVPFEVSITGGKFHLTVEPGQSFAVRPA